MAIIVFLFLSLVWGTTWLAIKISLSGIPPFLGAAARFSVAVGFLLLYTIIKRVSLKLPRGIFKILFTTALLMYALDYGLVYWGEQHLNAGVTAIFFATFPIFTGIFVLFIFKNEPYHWSKFAGLLVGFSGVFTIFWDQFLRTRFSPSVIFATLAIIIGAAGGALSTVMVKKYLYNLRLASLSLHQMIWGIICLGIIGVSNGEANRIAFNQKVLVAVFYLGGVGSALAFVLYYWLLKRVGPITVSTIIYITPLVALLADWMYFGETVTLRIVLGMFMIFAGIALSQSYPLRILLQKRRKQKVECTHISSGKID